MSFVKKTTPPPDVEEGDILKARILDIKKETSKWKNDDGTDKEQLRFEVELENGYKTSTWISYYEHPAEKSKLGKLVLKLRETTKEDPSNVEEFITAIKRFGHVFVKVKGFREYEDEVFPNFSLVTEKLPTHQMKIEQKPQAKTETKDYDVKGLLSRFKDAITFGLPLNVNDWNKSLLVDERLFLLKQGLVENSKEDLDLYFFTEKARVFFQ